MNVSDLSGKCQEIVSIFILKYLTSAFLHLTAKCVGGVNFEMRVMCHFKSAKNTSEW